ncbi:LacI family gluconate utilization system Gnt-I transcriptional repressor [Devosia sp. UYZn731]|uniref:LacI family DNA-binding transcriptional regulator n=1 Tax=Devosia sp. UYZn731 TaxID=3156345 RepID=UPI0033998DFB
MGAKRLAGRQRGVTLADVALLAQVSEITVSRILRNHGPIGADTRERVMAAVRQTGYVPNRLAGGLASSGSKLVGVIVPSLTNIVFPEVLGGIRSALEGTGFQAVIAVSDYDLATEQALIASLLAWKPEAMVIAGLDHTEMARAMLVGSGVRIAEVMEIDSQPIDLAVGLSHRQAGFDTGQYLLGRGYRRFGYVGHDWTSDHRAKLRYDGLVAALAEAKVALVETCRFEGPSSVGAGRDMLAQILARRHDLDVVVFSNDDMATGGVFHCLGAGIRPKQDLALFGFNGLDVGQALPTPLSTVRSNRFLIGKTAIEKLLGQRERPEGREIIDTGYDIITGATA